MVSFVGRGTDIARALSNALLFCDDKAQHLPGVVLVELSPEGVAFTATDDYAVGRDYDGAPAAGTMFTIDETDAEEVARMARSARTANVKLECQNERLTITIGDEESSVPVGEVDSLWLDFFLPMLEPAGDGSPLPVAVAFNPAKFTRFGRVKASKDAPVDIRFEPTELAPTALVRVGPTFRGALQAVERAVAAEKMGPSGEGAFWS